MRCNARANAPEALGRNTSLKCDDECARLQRNRNLARALHIPDDHSDEHVPYSTTTLKMYLEDVAWAHKQEDILRAFAADENEKRYRFKPMKNRQRAFVHSLAEDFGFDGESLDPEPHRHVLLFKTPKFVAAPMKTLAQAARIKRAQLNVSALINSEPQRKADEVKHEYNGLLLTNPRFALTEDELRPLIKKSTATTEFDIIFLSNDQGVAFLPTVSSDHPDQMINLLTSRQPPIAAEVAKHELGASVILCQFDTSDLEPRIIEQQGKAAPTLASGWSQVAARRAAPMAAPQVQPVGQRPIFTILGSRLAEAKKQKESNEAKLRKKAPKQDVAEDWEKEVDQEETAEADRRTSGASLKTVDGDPVQGN